MAAEYWKLIKYFEAKEFDSPDEVESGGEKMDEKLIKAIDYVRQQIEQPLYINSGYRTERHNAEVGGVPNSQHRLGKACDVRIHSQEMGDSIEYWFKDFVGEDCGIGRYDTFIHIDTRDKKARWDNRSK